VAHWLEHDWPRIKRRAARTHAHLVFIDETGFLLHPLVRRTWSPRGQTPRLPQRTRHRRKVSTIGGLSISPQRQRLGLYWKLHLDQGIAQDQVIEFLAHLRRQLRNRLVVVWDRLAAHRGRQLRRWLQRGRGIHLEFFPPYAPHLNPIEYLWAHTKTNPLANYAPDSAEQLETAVVVAVTNLGQQQRLLRSFVQASGLPIRLRA
jgi:transposase